MDMVEMDMVDTDKGKNMDNTEMALVLADDDDTDNNHKDIDTHIDVNQTALLLIVDY
jgi:hypothetical protein